MLALLDGDIVCYRCAAVTENDDEALAKWQADELIQRILADTGALDWQLFLSGENNFRYQIYPDYKANRRDKPKPKHLEAVREHLVRNWNARITNGYEADDALGIKSRDQSTRTVVCSIDKDLRQLEGLHYHFVNREFISIDSRTGWYNFYLQLLIGDSADNISGCPGIGKAKAPRILETATTPIEMYQACLAAYLKQGSTLHDMELNARLLYILRREDDEWTPPIANTPIAQPAQAVPQ